MGTSPQKIAARPLTSVKLTASGKCQKNEFLTQTDLFNVITWFPPVGTASLVVKYKIYRDMGLTDLIAIVPTSQPRQFEDHNRPAGATSTYFVVAEAASGSPLASGTVSVTSCE